MFCVPVIIMMQRISGTIQQYTNEDGDDQLPERIVVCDSSIKGSCSVTPPPDIHNDIFSPSANEVRTLSEILVDVVDLIPIQLEHCPRIEAFYFDPKDIRDFLFEKKWLDVGILQVWCT